MQTELGAGFIKARAHAKRNYKVHLRNLRLPFVSNKKTEILTHKTRLRSTSKNLGLPLRALYSVLVTYLSRLHLVSPAGAR